MKIGLASLALGSLSGWGMVLTIENPDRLRAIGIRHLARVRQIHLDWIIMGLILIAVGTAYPDLAGWIAALIVVGAIVNPLLFVPLAFTPNASSNPAYRAVSAASFTALSVGLSAAFLTAL